MHEGKKVYRFNHLQMYIDRGSAVIYENGQWWPVDVNTLKQKALK